MASFTISGASAFETMLGKLPKKMSKKIVRKSVRAAQKPVLAAAKSNAKTMVGGNMGSLIAKNIKIKAPKKQRRGQYQLGVKIVENEQFIAITKEGRRYYIPMAIEYGHGHNKERAAEPFMRNAANSNEKKAIKSLTKEIGNGIDQAVRETTNAK